MSESSRDRLDQPRELGGVRLLRPKLFRQGAFGTASEAFARYMGTPKFLLWMTVFVALWLIWNTFMPEALQFDPRALNYTLLTLMLSLQASYAAPLLLLAQNRQDDRDRVIAERDRSRDERNLADTEYLTREVAGLRLALGEVVTRDYLRSELRDLLEELTESSDGAGGSSGRTKHGKRKKSRSGAGKGGTGRAGEPDRAAEADGAAEAAGNGAPEAEEPRR